MGVFLSDALDYCNRIFEIMAESGYSEDMFSPAMKIPLKREFGSVLDGFRIELKVRYGMPTQDSKRSIVPVRVQAVDEVRYGNIYLVKNNAQWYLEQWELNLQGLPMDALLSKDSDAETSDAEETGKKEDSGTGSIELQSQASEDAD